MEGSKCFPCFSPEQILWGKFQKVPTKYEPSEILQEINDPVYKVENILPWRHKKIKNKYICEFLVLWAGYPLEEGTWEPEDSFLVKQALHKDLDSEPIMKINEWSGILLLSLYLYFLNFQDQVFFKGGNSCDIAITNPNLVLEFISVDGRVWVCWDIEV